MAGSCGASRVLGLAHLTVGKALDSIIVPRTPEERRMVESPAWSDSVAVLRVGARVPSGAPVSFDLTSPSRLGSPSAALCASLASKKLQRSPG